jgi:hypothetical protein
MGWIRRPREGRGWEARYRGSDRRERSRTFRTKGEAQRFLAAGHSSITVTLGRYGHLLPGQDEAIADRLDRAHRRAEARSGGSETLQLPLIPKAQSHAPASAGSSD